MDRIQYLLLALLILAAPWGHGAVKGISFTTLGGFNNTNSGANPYAPPVLGADGNLYGAVPFGGTNGAAVIFKITTNGQQTTLFTFNTTNGASAVGQLVSGQDGSLYGVAGSGGTNGQGTIFAVTTNGAFTLLYSFGMVTNAAGYALDGASPYGGLIQGRDGNFYGTTYQGGPTNKGTVFQFSTNGTLTVLHSFLGDDGSDDGAYPYTAPLVEGADGIFYGTTSEGGTNGSGTTFDGTIFRVTAAGAFTTLFEFNKTNGLNPYAGLSFGTDGKLYGSTVNGGANGYGTVFQITTNGSLTTLIQFSGTNGAFPEGGVVPGPDNILYGTTYEGGTQGYGTVFQLTTNGLLTTLYSFTNSTDGSNPYAGVIRDAGGNLYGAALYGGTLGGYGTVYRLRDSVNPTNTLTTPTANQRWSNLVFSATGKASDNVSVADVFYSLNGAAWTDAATTNNWTNWTAQIALAPGTNTLQAYARDHAGNFSATNFVSFDFVVTNRLLVSALGLGTISPNYSNAWLEIGRNYSVTSAPASGFVFGGWLVSTNGTGAITSRTNLAFMMQSNLTLQAIFSDVTKPTLTFTTPTAGQKMTNALATLTGKAADNWQVSNVWYQLNSGAWNLGTTTNKYTNWSAPTLTLIAGTNWVNAYAQDLGGNLSTTNSLSFVSSNTFQLQFNFAAAPPLTSTGLNFSMQLSPHLNGHIQVSTNLATWTILTNFVGTNAILNFRDRTATNFNQRFYRAVIP